MAFLEFSEWLAKQNLETERDCMNESPFPFGKYAGKDVSELSTGFLSSVVGTMKDVNLKREIEQILASRQNGTTAVPQQPQKTYPPKAPSVPAMLSQGIQQPPQGQPFISPKWTLADKIYPIFPEDDHDDPNELVGVVKSGDNWKIKNLKSGEEVSIPNAEIKKVIESIKDENGKTYQSDSFENLKKLAISQKLHSEPESSKSKDQSEAKPVGKLEKNILGPDKIPEGSEGWKIDQKFAKIINAPGVSHMAIAARAGTGKSTTLRHLSSKYGKPGEKWLYLVFNTKNKVEAQESFPPWVEVKTSNGWCGEVLGMPENRRNIKKTDRVVDLADKDERKINKLKIISDGPQFQQELTRLGFPEPEDFSSNKGLYSIVNSIRYAVKSAVVQVTDLLKAFAVNPRTDQEIKQKIDEIYSKYDIDDELENVKDRLDGSRWIDTINNLFGKDFMSMNFAKEIKEGALWLLHQSVPGGTNQTLNKGREVHNLGNYRDFNDDLWYFATHANQLVVPKYKVALIDEAQDMNESQKIVIKKLMDAGAKVIVVGDQNQCVIEGTLIETENGKIPVELCEIGQNAIVAKGGGSKTLAAIDEIFCRYVENQTLIKITTSKGYILTTTPEHTHFAQYFKSNDPSFFTYLMYRENFGYRVGITQSDRNGGTRINQERADKIWFIESCPTRAEAQFYEQYYSIKYGLPSWVFNFEKESSQSHYVHQLFDLIDTESNAKKLLNDKDMFLEYPHHIPRCLSRKRYRNFNITLCGDSRGTGLHRYSIAGSDFEDTKLIDGDVKIRSAKRGWRSESSITNLKSIYDIMESLSDKIDINVIEKARLTNTTLAFTPASHVLKGMTIYVNDVDKIIDDTVISVEKIQYSGNVYDLNIHQYHNFIANNICTHNSVYRFRGADHKALGNITDMLKAHSEDKDIEHTLTKNFRSKKKIIDYANSSTHVKDLQVGRKSDEGDDGSVTEDMGYEDAFENIAKVRKDQKNGDTIAFIARTNEPLVHAALKLLKMGLPFVITGKDIARELTDHIDKIIRITRLNGMAGVNELSQKLSYYAEDERDKHQNKAAKSDYLKELKESTEAITAAITQFSSEKPSGTIDQFKMWLKSKFGGLDLEGSERDINQYKSTVKTLNPIVLTTSHRSKGLEFEDVYVLRKDQFPHPRAKREEDLEVEKNLDYVTKTRARNNLHMLDPEGQPGYRGPTKEAEPQEY